MMDGPINISTTAVYSMETAEHAAGGSDILKGEYSVFEISTLLPVSMAQWNFSLT
jgi:hypothetical protein